VIDDHPVVSSGVLLYQMFDPLGRLAVVPGLVRKGGICVIETTVAFDDSDVMHFNSAGRFTRSALWFVTPRLLDYLARFLRLEPLDAVYFGVSRKEPGKPAHGRLAVACRAVSAPVAEPGDEWMLRGKEIDFLEFLDWSAVASDAPGRLRRPEGGADTAPKGAVDLQISVEATSPLPAGPDDVRLSLEARY
jgi:hypothetical protein